MASFRGILIFQALAFSGNAGLGDAVKILCWLSTPQPTRRTGSILPSRNTCLSAGGWTRDENKDMFTKFFDVEESKTNSRGGSSIHDQQKIDVQNYSPSLITKEMEDEVMASARAAMDTNTVSRAISSLIEDETKFNSPAKKGKNRLRDLATATGSKNMMFGIRSSNVGNTNRDATKNESAWDTQQIAIASGATTFLLSPLVIPIIHSFLPPIIPSPSSISITGAALLGTISYIVALGDTSEQSSPIPGTPGGVLGDGVEVGGAASRMLGRTALLSVRSSAPRLKAAARALVDYENNSAALEESRRVQNDLLQSVMRLEMENKALRRELALWQDCEEISNMYKLEELKEIARYHELKGYSSDGKNSLIRRLAKEGILKIDLRSS